MLGTRELACHPLVLMTATINLWSSLFQSPLISNQVSSF